MVRNKAILLICLTVHMAWILPVECQQPLRLGAFNIQIFGIKKAKNTYVMDELVKIIQRYDLLLIQEIRDNSQTAVKELLSKVNANRPTDDVYSMVVSSRTGRTASKEQYAFMYRKASGIEITRTAEFDDGSETKVNNTYLDKFQREPYLIEVTSRYTVPNRFAVIGIHVDPGEAVKEINALEGVFNFIKTNWGIQDVVAMGDMNADCNYVRKTKWKSIPLRNNADYAWLICDDIDTTVKRTHCAYDRFIFTGPSWASGVDPESAVAYRYDTATNGMSSKQAKAISDHYPIEFLLKRKEARNGFEVSIRDVRFELKTKYRSLKKNVVYYLHSDTNRFEGAFISVVDARNTVYGTFRNDEVVQAALVSIIKKHLNDKPITVVPLSRKYRNTQKVKLTVHVQSSNDEKTARDMLKETCKRFNCSPPTIARSLTKSSAADRFKRYCDNEKKPSG